MGSWTVKELAAHTARAFTTIEAYLATPPGDLVVPNAVAYFRRSLADPIVHEAVAERGRQDAAGLGADPVGSIAISAERVRGIVTTTEDDVVIASAAGGIRFAEYLRTRTLELTVHTTDLCAAIDLDEEPPEVAADVAMSLLGGLAAAHPRRGDILRALTGRADLDELNLLG